MSILELCSPRDTPADIHFSLQGFTGMRREKVALCSLTSGVASSGSNPNIISFFSTLTEILAGPASFLSRSAASNRLEVAAYVR